MLRLFSASIVRQIVAITLALLAFSTAAIVCVTYYNLSSYVMQSAVSDAKDASRTMGILYGAGLGRLGLDPNRLIVVRVKRPVDALWVARRGATEAQ